MMEIYWRVLVSLPKVLWYKIKYAGKCTLPWIQAFGHHTELKIKNGKASFGKEQITRGNAVFRVEGGELVVGDKCFFNQNVSITCKKKIVIGATQPMNPPHRKNVIQLSIGSTSLLSIATTVIMPMEASPMKMSP